MLGLHCSTQAFSACVNGDYSSCSVPASHYCSFSCEEHVFQGTCAQEAMHSLLWDLPKLGIEPVSLALAGGFLTTGPPKKSKPSYFKITCHSI